MNIRIIVALVCFIFFYTSVMAQDKSVPSSGPTVFTKEEAEDPKFPDSLSHIVVKFVENNGEVLRGEFKTRFSFAIFEFKVLPNGRGGFGKTSSKDRIEFITQEEFLRKLKEDMWLIQYREISGQKFIYQASQIKSIQSLAGSFAQDPNDNYQTVEMVEFWHALKVKAVDAKELDLNTMVFSWRVMIPVSETMGRVVETGKFKISPYCVFDGMAKKSGNKASGLILQLSFDYFKNNLTKHIWTVFYSSYNPYDPNSNESLNLALRIVTQVQEDSLTPKTP